ncbi:LysR family transcriptional regulator [Nitratidesulfovibrio sp. SRB-5]|uniref:LysR family transcriptional regulator n=1 Tax=Nitratidesulfovibrio sp. SRB-5 TaxID=2872636 RepID=UPI001025DA93|nr:LysR family transcriptional regulator [Nitratidesulfovibrio sp. SRB-5]MBZ2172135.1 LysR family transcriptional regulator [Nitratidesulfovibrio sp. SRB-5]RXF76408.1 LysR family transcriptional regulator [Desulfovibrio sp. DS-1]
MEFRTLQAFVEVVRHGGFSAAAKALFTTQSNVSKAVRQLESELGVVLLDRMGSRSQLTDAGEVVFRRARGIMAATEDIQGELDDLRGLRRGTLRLGVPLFGSRVLFAPVFALFRTRYPGVDVGMVEDGSRRLGELLHAGEVDLAASLTPISGEFEWQHVRAEPLVALLPPGHALAGKPRLRLRELANEPFILFGEAFQLNQIILDGCERNGFRPRVAARSGQMDFIIGLVEAGLGVALLPRLMVADHTTTAARVLLDEPDMWWRMALIWRRGGYLSHAARAWLDLAREVHGIVQDAPANSG